MTLLDTIILHLFIWCLRVWNKSIHLKDALLSKKKYKDSLNE